MGFDGRAYAGYTCMCWSSKWCLQQGWPPLGEVSHTTEQLHRGTTQWWCARCCMGNLCSECTLCHHSHHHLYTTTSAVGLAFQVCRNLTEYCNLRTRCFAALTWTLSLPWWSTAYTLQHRWLVALLWRNMSNICTQCQLQLDMSSRLVFSRSITSHYSVSVNM